MGLITGAVLSSFIGVAGTFGSLQSASMSASFFPSMENCVEYMNYATRPAKLKNWKQELPPNMVEGDQGITFKVPGTNNVIEYICHPQG